MQKFNMCHNNFIYIIQGKSLAVISLENRVDSLEVSDVIMFTIYVHIHIYL
jgi:hypothetical protein